MLEKFFSRPDDLSQRLWGRIITTDPIITISKRTRDAPLGIPGAAPGFFRRKNALHILSNTWNHYNENRIRLLHKELKQLSRQLVDNHFLYLGNTQCEVMLLSKHGISAMFSSELLPIDDTVFRPDAEQVAKIPATDAVYVARLKDMKRHELAYDLGNLALVYGKDFQDKYEKIRREKPQWTYVNHMLGKGEYYRLNPGEVAGVLNQCRVGLCLSKEEGAMRASMEYLMCGLPVVSTRNVGGRDRYLTPENCIYAEDNPASVAASVQAFLDNPPDRMAIRDDVIRKVNFDRADFLRSVNEIFEHIYQIPHRLDSYTSIVGYLEKYQSAEEILADIENL